MALVSLRFDVDFHPAQVVCPMCPIRVAVQQKATRYQRRYCCDVSFGPKGNVQCWDDVYHFDRCCEGVNLNNSWLHLSIARGPKGWPPRQLMVMNLPSGPHQQMSRTGEFLRVAHFECFSHNLWILK